MAKLWCVVVGKDCVLGVETDLSTRVEDVQQQIKENLPEKRVESYKVNDTPAWEWKEEAYLLECFETAQWSSSAVIVPSSSFKAFMNTITSEPQAAQSTNGKSRSPTTFAF
uniref:Uncharacterized protein n=1 Tax=Globisporangium ultimum (strain ATCC 200006 / CBS 805.95 / DAOM BR144) TaxID=431595 RepID=K3WCK7_GLOUD